MKLRTKYLIYPKVQWALVVIHLISLLAFFALTLFFWGDSLSEFISLGKKAQLPVNHIYYQYLDILMRNLLKKLVLSLGITMLIGTLFYIWFSHHFIGPIVGLIEYLKQIGAGQNNLRTSKPIRFRNKDFFHELADAVNEALDVTSKNESKNREIDPN